MKCISIIIIIFSSSQSLVSSLDLRIKYVRSDEEANGTRLYALDFLGLIKKHGREAEWHNVTTSDGYILSLFRIPANPASSNKTHNSRPIYLQHGLFATADILILFGSGRSLAYSLSDAGYDVWIGSLRGEHYSLRHKKYSTDDAEFWDFSLDEQALEDLPAMFDYIIETTGQPQLSYIGHSLGTTLILMLLSDKPEYNSKLTAITLLAPVSHWKTWNPTRVSMVIGIPFLKSTLPNGPIDISIVSTIPPTILDYFCVTNRMTASLCGIISMMSSELRGQLDMSEEVLLLQHILTGTSGKVLMHYGQHIRKGNFGHYDFGTRAANREAYGQDEPPEYNLSNVKTPTIIFGAQHDGVATLENTDDLIGRLPKDIKLKYEIIRHANFAHRDFLIAKNAEEELYKPMLKILEEFLWP